ncbi:MAG: hypothetical protein HND52_20845 [Ignavibacteriae bacterium]|nr:hypothetical protein [Ignavibacteriota bacterium]NOH00420.1 hypothetical protein [Ignavibacteriota bacterium]
MKQQLVICVENEGYEASLEKRKLYVKLKDEAASKHNQIRVIDESGEDYLFPSKWFVEVTLPKDTEQAVLSAA